MSTNDIKDLLVAVKDEIISSAGLLGVRDVDIYIADDLAVVPSAARYPCIAVKDGDVERHRYVNCYDAVIEVMVAVYQLLKSGEDALLATDPATLGVLDLATSIRDVLDDNYLNVDGVYMMDLPSEEGTELVGPDELGLLRKVITYRYYRRINDS